jgi:hypothetical protein
MGMLEWGRRMRANKENKLYVIQELFNVDGYACSRIVLITDDLTKARDYVKKWQDPWKKGISNYDPDHCCFEIHEFSLADADLLDKNPWDVEEEDE